MAPLLAKEEVPMPSRSTPQYRGSPIDALLRRWQDWMGKWSATSELRCCGEDEVKRIAQDVGVSVAELHKLAKRGPHSADLLLRRMVELDLDRNEVARTEPRTFQDLQRVCTLCEAHRRCTRDFAHHSTEEWESYCPNATTLKALNAQPWAARAEW
jgi:hypothetical protein